MSEQRLLICPYCGETQPESERCRACAGLFEPLSRQATHNAMGPWFIRDEQRPHQPGCSYETLVKLIQRGRVSRYTIVRGPTTRQFWTIAKRVPGISHFFGACYQCDASVDADDHACHTCGATFGGFLDRNFLGLPEYRPLPWEADRGGPRRPEVEPGEPSDWRQQTASASGGPRGISSFASDVELFGQVPETSGDDAASSGVEGNAAEESNALPVSAPTVPSLQPTPAATMVDERGRAAVAMERDRDAMAEIHTAAASPSSSPAESAAPSEAVLRSLRRTLERQQRTIRGLMIAVVVLAAVGIVTGLLWLDSRSPAVDRDSAPSPSESADTTSEGLLPATDAFPRDSVEADDKSEAWRDQSSAGAGSFDEAHREAYDRAARLIERASSDERDLGDRIEDLEQAVVVLERLERDVSSAALPEEFSDLLQGARRELERLRLQQFFP